MRTLILSCNTGQGHNSCSEAIREEYLSQGEYCHIEDALQFISQKFSDFVSSWHVKLYRYAPALSDFGYAFAEKHPAMITHENSVIYRVLTAGAEQLYRYLTDENYEAVICTHVFSTLLLSEMLKRHPMKLRTCFVATDYTNSPGRDDTLMDYYFIPDDSLTDEFAGSGIPKDRIVGSGIPVRKVFYSQVPKKKAKAIVGVDQEHIHLVMMCGSMGCGPIPQLTRTLAHWMPDNAELTVMCGSNERLRHKLEKKYYNNEQIHIRGYEKNISLFLDSADVYLTKPGGISVVEAATKQLPMIFIDAVAGCEKYNRRYFVNLGGAKSSKNMIRLSALALNVVRKKNLREKMVEALLPEKKKEGAKTIYLYMTGKYEPQREEVN